MFTDTIILVAGSVWFFKVYKTAGTLAEQTIDNTNATIPKSTEAPYASNPLTIEHMRSREYFGGTITTERDLGIIGPYHSYIVSYPSEGLKIRALLTIPKVFWKDI